VTLSAKKGRMYARLWIATCNTERKESREQAAIGMWVPSEGLKLLGYLYDKDDGVPRRVW
jgi:hypothetical protein